MCAHGPAPDRRAVPDHDAFPFDDLFGFMGPIFVVSLLAAVDHRPASIIGVVIWAIRRNTPRRESPAVEELKARLARGEISPTEYQVRIRALHDGDESEPPGRDRAPGASRDRSVGLLRSSPIHNRDLAGMRVLALLDPPAVAPRSPLDMISTGELRKGVAIELDGELWQILDYHHIKMGRGSAQVRITLRNIKRGQTVERSFQAGTKWPRASMEKRPGPVPVPRRRRLPLHGQRHVRPVRPDAPSSSARRPST